jgi:hypothetical protein
MQQLRRQEQQQRQQFQSSLGDVSQSQLQQQSRMPRFEGGGMGGSAHDFAEID